MSVDPSQVAAAPSEAASAPEAAGAPATLGAWEDLLDARDLERFCAAWLAIECEQIGGVRAGVLAWRRIDDDDPKTLATWPARVRR